VVELCRLRGGRRSKYLLARIERIIVANLPHETGLWPRGAAQTELHHLFNLDTYLDLHGWNKRGLLSVSSIGRTRQRDAALRLNIPTGASNNLLWGYRRFPSVSGYLIGYLCLV